MALCFAKKQFPSETILMAVRWYVAYKLSYRDIEELLAERGVLVDHATLHRWVLEYAPQLEEVFRGGKKRAISGSWRMDETYIKVKGQWLYLYRAVDKSGDTIDFMLTEKRDEAAARRFFNRHFAAIYAGSIIFSPRRCRQPSEPSLHLSQKRQS